jgi:hypothetical protein
VIVIAVIVTAVSEWEEGKKEISNLSRGVNLKAG